MVPVRFAPKLRSERESQSPLADWHSHGKHPDDSFVHERTRSSIDSSIANAAGNSFSSNTVGYNDS